MNKLKVAFNLLKDTGEFKPSQLHYGNDSLWITPYCNAIFSNQLRLAMAAARLFNLTPSLTCEPDFKLVLFNF